MNPVIDTSRRVGGPPATPPVIVRQPSRRDSSSQTTTPISTSPLRSAPHSEERTRRALNKAFHSAFRQMRVDALSLVDFRDISKNDLRRGDILLTHEAVPSSHNHEKIQASQRQPDLNNIDNNCGMAEIVHAGIILRDDVVAAEQNPVELGPTDHPYLSERGGVGTTNALRAIGSAVPAGMHLVYRATDPMITDILVDDTKAKEGVPYSSMELGSSLKGAEFVLPPGLAERNTINHILAVGRDRHETQWANEVCEDEFSDLSELAYAEADRVADIEGTRRKGPGASCSTFIVKGIQAAFGAATIARTDHDLELRHQSRSHMEPEEKARVAYYDDFPETLRIDAKRNAPKTLMHLLETVEVNGNKLFERAGKLSVDQMAYPERTFNPLTGDEIIVNAGNVVP